MTNENSCGAEKSPFELPTEVRVSNGLNVNLLDGRTIDIDTLPTSEGTLVCMLVEFFERAKKSVKPDNLFDKADDAASLVYGWVSRSETEKRLSGPLGMVLNDGLDRLLISTGDRKGKFDPLIVYNPLRALLYQRIHSGQNQRAIAASWGVSEEQVSNAVRHLRNPADGRSLDVDMLTQGLARSGMVPSFSYCPSFSYRNGFFREKSVAKEAVEARLEAPVLSEVKPSDPTRRELQVAHIVATYRDDPPRLNKALKNIYGSSSNTGSMRGIIECRTDEKVVRNILHDSDYVHHKRLLKQV